MEKIIAFLESAKIDTADIDPYLKHAINFYDDFFSRYPTDDLSSYRDLDYIQYIVLFLSRNNPERLLSIENFIYSNEKFFCSLKFEHLTCLFIVLMHPIFREIYSLRGSLKIVMKIFDTEKLAFFEHLNSYYTNDVIIKLFMRVFFLEDFINLLDDLDFTLAQARQLSDDLNALKVLVNFINSHRDEKRLKRALENSKVLDEAKKVIKARVNETFEVRKIYSYDCAGVIKRNNLIDRMIRFVKENPEYMPLYVLKEVIRFQIDDDIKDAFLDYAGELNAKAEERMLKEYEVSQNSHEKVIGRLLAQFGIDILLLNDSEKEIVLKMESEDLETMLKFLSKYQIAYSSVAQFLLYDVTKIKIVSSLIERKILTEEFLKKYLNILLKDNNYLSMIERNIDFLYSYGINIINYPESLDILLCEIETNLDYLKLYGIRIHKKTKNIDFLADSNLLFKLDLLVEMGLYDGKKLDILNSSYEEIYQRGLCKKLNVEYDANLFRSLNISDFMPDTSFLIPDDILALLRKAKTIGTLPEYLEKYVVDMRTIVIEGIVISLPRLLRNLSPLDNNNPEEVYMAVLYGGYYTLEETLILQKVIAPDLKGALKRDKKTSE